jgi:hypothetical protein
MTGHPCFPVPPFWLPGQISRKEKEGAMQDKGGVNRNSKPGPDMQLWVLLPVRAGKQPQMLLSDAALLSNPKRSGVFPSRMLHFEAVSA